MRESAQMYDVRMAQFVLKIEKLSHIMGPRASQDLRSPSLVMAPAIILYLQESCLNPSLLWKNYEPSEIAGEDLMSIS